MSSFRFCVKLIGFKPNQGSLLSKKQIQLFQNQIASISTIRSKKNMTKEELESIRSIKPWPYKEKGYNYWHQHFLDANTSKRFHDNSKVIVVEGPPAAGKTKFAQGLADELDMKYFEMGTMDFEYINHYGFDMRTLDDKIDDPKCKSFDEKRFIREPTVPYAQIMQYKLYKVRLSQYIDALCHLFNTGQGVVVDRSHWGSHSFAKAMFDSGYMEKKVFDGYDYMEEKANPTEKVVTKLLKPHVVIYLDVSADKTLENLKKRGQGEEKTVHRQFIQSMEDDYKMNILPKLEKTSEVLIYDWNESGDPELVIEDIERIDFDKFIYFDDPKMEDWRFTFEEDVNLARFMVTNGKGYFLNLLDLPLFDLDILFIEGWNYKQYRDVFYAAPGNKYQPGFNSEMGDKGVLFKHKGKTAFRNNYPIVI